MNLKKAALVFQELLDIEYKIIVGRKGKTTEFTIGFSKEHFFHLVGLHKLNDLNFPTKNKERLFDLIIDDEITEDFILKSSKANPIISERIEPFIDIVNIIDDNNLVFKFNRSRNNWTNMRCKFILENIEQDKTVYVFIDNDKKNDKMFCRSFFLKTRNDFTTGSTKMALLYKEKINNRTKESTIQVDKLKGR